LNQEKSRKIKKNQEKSRKIKKNQEKSRNYKIGTNLAKFQNSIILFFGDLSC
jgi:hypothetical protein